MGIGIPLLAQAGISYAAARHADSRKRHEEIKGQRQSFNQRMELAEKYGIHPLQAIGGAGTFTGSGGGNVGQMIDSYKASRARKQQRQQAIQDDKIARQRTIDDREDNQAHQRDLKNMDIQAQDTQFTRELNQRKLDANWRSDWPTLWRSTGNWFRPNTFDMPGDAEAREFDDIYGNPFNTPKLKFED